MLGLPKPYVGALLLLPLLAEPEKAGAEEGVDYYSQAWWQREAYHDRLMELEQLTRERVVVDPQEVRRRGWRRVGQTGCAGAGSRGQTPAKLPTPLELSYQAEA